MSGPTWTLVRSAGRGRAVLLAACTAVVSGLLLVAVALVQLPANPDEYLFSLVADPGTRGGTTFAVVALTLPPLLLLHQAVRLGTASRERRLAALRLAGATPAEVRRLGALEVGAPSLLGAILGIGVYAVLRGILGGTPMTSFGGTQRLRIVPISVTPSWWQVLIVVAVVTAAGVAVGLAASRHLVVTPLGVSRRAPGSPPRPWGLGFVLLGALLVPAMLSIGSDTALAGVLTVGLVLLGLVTLSPWAAYRAGAFAASRATSAPLLLAARRLVVEPRPAGRAAAAVGGIAAVGGGATAVLVDLLHQSYVDEFFTVSLALVAVALLVSLLVVAGTLAVHSAESLLDRKRSMASLAALGTPVEVLERSQRWEAALVALPMATAGTLLGGSSLLLMGRVSPLGLTILLAALLLTLALVWLAVVVSVRTVRPWTRRAVAATNLRTE